MKSTVSLDARIFDSGNFRTPPIAPPRKKRGSTLKKGSTLPTAFASDGAVHNGFKDVFINGGAARVLTYDDIEYIDKDESVIQTRADIEDNDEKLADRKLKVGNKKTDKFFGESLSDHLSDEPVVPTVEEPKSISNDEVDRSSTSEKKIFFLMNMLEQEQEENEIYKDMVPIEEPIFIARKKEIKKHICDDDDHMHAHFHHNEKEPCDHVAPPKPDRDFSKYHSNVTESDQKATQDAVNEKLEEVQAKIRVMKSISREHLPSPPATPKRKSGIGSMPSTPTITIESIDFNTSTTNDYLKGEEKAEKQQKRPPSLNLSRAPEIDPIMQDQAPKSPILSHEMVGKMMKKAYGFHDYHPEDTEHNDDGSNLVAPTSKLTTRKVSVGRKISTESSPSIDGDSVKNMSERLTPDTPRKKISFSDDPLLKAALSRTPPKSPIRDQAFEQMLAGQSMNDIIEEIYSKNSEIMQEFQSYLEKTVESKPVINVDEEKEFLKAKGIIDNEFNRHPEPPKVLDIDEDVDDNQAYSDSFESTDTEQETVTELSKIQSRLPKHNRGRRESIEDVGDWFSNHLNLEQKKSEVNGSFDPEPQGNPGYDTQKTFPFGRTITGRRESLSDEFFNDIQSSLLKPHISTLRESESSDDGEREKEASSFREKSPDHSSLMKFLDKEKREQ